MNEDLPWAPIELVYEKAYSNVALIPFLRTRVEVMTLDYLDNFEKHDVERIVAAANSKDPLDKFFVWICRKYGTNICKERDVFIRNAAANKTVLAASSSQTVLAFFVEVLGEDNGEIYGNVFMLNLQEYRSEVIAQEQWPAKLQVTYENGYVDTIPPDSYRQLFCHGDITETKLIPENEIALAKTLVSHKNRRDTLRLAKTDEER